MDSTGELPPPRPKGALSKAIVGFAICVSVAAVALGVALGSLCGPNGVFTYGGGSSAAATYLVIGLIVALGAAGVAVFFGARMVSELVKQYDGESPGRTVALAFGLVVALFAGAAAALRIVISVAHAFKLPPTDSLGR